MKKDNSDLLDKVTEECIEFFNKTHNDPDIHFTCVICGKECIGMGNDAEPYKEGRCCDECNQKYVLPKRGGLSWE